MQPENKSGYPGWTYVDSITAIGEGTLTYRWEYQLKKFAWQLLGTGRIITFETPLEGYAFDEGPKVPIKCTITNSFGCTIESNIVILDLFAGI
ncbi:MAG: hypothetical protein JW915_22815 [Chitinispirillaceae bacterium]|nr:hypothetical protein [Chitinispirillaceae bacterium]